MAEEKELPRNPVELNGVPDLSMLIYMEMPNVMFNLKTRYCDMTRKYCYTSISTILVAINPYEKLPIYGEDVLNEFHREAKQGRLPQGRPHPYGVSARSYMRMVQRRANQSIIVCGESGAGKTETTKILMRYLAMTSPSKNSETSFVERQIIAASPILEAFGNAKTILNNNSSRFGKFTKLLYDVPQGQRDGHILGSYLETYLLEKSRVVTQSGNERNYHIFYFMHAGIHGDERELLGLTSPDDFFYSNQGEAATVPGIDDEALYRELVESLGLMRVEDEQQDLWRLVAGVLHMGNVEFQREGDGYCAIHPRSIGHINKIAELWGVTPEALDRRLTTQSLKVMKKTIEQKVTFDNAVPNRDSISKALYENAFLWLCYRINLELLGGEDVEEATDLLFIGILDVFGFENFMVNSLEQFCINFTNEKLQQFFNFHIIRSEQEEYIKESVFWTPLSVPDNLDLIDMIEDPDNGFFRVLDSTCHMPQPTVEALMQELLKRHGENPTFHEARKNPRVKQKSRSSRARFLGFTLNHFADNVTYDSELFVAKNMEKIHPDTAKMMKQSSIALVQQIGGGETGGRKKKRRKKATVTGVFNKGIQTLMENLNKTEPFFVRCVNPNKKKSSRLWDEDLVEHQLKCGGLVEALKVLKLGYPTRVPYNTLYEKYHSHVNNPLIQKMGPESFSTAILIAFDVAEDDYELGLTKIFFKPAKAAVLDKIMAQAGIPLTEEQNRKITAWIVRKRLKQVNGIVKTFVSLRYRVRMARAAMTWQHVGRVGGILGLSLNRYLRQGRERLIERKRNEGAALFQQYILGAIEQVRYKRHLADVREATRMIWTSFSRWNGRSGLGVWLGERVEATRRRLEEEAREKMEEDARQAAAERRMEMERKRHEEEETRREQERQLAEARRLAQEEAESKRKEEELAVARAKQEEAAREMEAQKQEERVAALKRQATERDSLAAQNALRMKEEEQQRKQNKRERKEKQGREYMKQMFPEQEDDDDDYSASDFSDSDVPEPSLEEQLRNFKSLSKTGQLFLKYAGRRRRKPQDRIVKISYSSNGRPKTISWGSGSRHIDFPNVKFVSWGLKTPVFQARRSELTGALCFSVIGKAQVLDIQAPNPQTAELWVRGLRNLLGHTQEQSDELFEEWFSTDAETTGTGGPEGAKPEREHDHKRRTRSLMLLQQDLFVMTTTTVFRSLEEEGIWQIDDTVRAQFSAQRMYEKALRDDIPWREWSVWVRKLIVNYLRETGKVRVPDQPAPPKPQGRRRSSFLRRQSQTEPAMVSITENPLDAQIHPSLLAGAAAAASSRSGHRDSGPISMADVAANVATNLSRRDSWTRASLERRGSGSIRLNGPPKKEEEQCLVQ